MVQVVWNVGRKRDVGDLDCLREELEVVEAVGHAGVIQGLTEQLEPIRRAILRWFNAGKN